MQNKVKGFGFRGWLLIIYQAVAYLAFQTFTQYPLNILADFYGGAQKVSGIYSVCAIVGILIQIILVSWISKMKSIKAFASILGAITLVLAFLVMSMPPSPVWYAAYAVINVVAVLYSTLALGLIVGQWFPTRKGTVMGIVTMAFPIITGICLSLFIECHCKNCRTESAGFFCFFEKSRFALFQTDRVHNTFSLSTAKSGTENIPAGRVDHQRYSGNFGFSSKI